MELIMQPTFSTCGQACIAMIAGKSVEEVIILNLNKNQTNPPTGASLLCVSPT